MSHLAIASVIVGLAAVVLGAVVWIRHRYIVVTVFGSSMEPVLHEGQQVIVRRTAPGRIRPAAVVVLRDATDVRGEVPASVRPRFDREPLFGRGIGPCVIKRVVAVPGDPVPRSRVPALRDAAETLVPPGKVVLLGDNARDSYDSRERGYFSIDRLLGVVVKPIGSERVRR